MKIFLTGYSGFIGKKFCKAALSKGYFIYALSRKKIKIINKKKNIKFLIGKLTDNWNKELKNSDLLVHFASSNQKEKDLNKIFDTNIFDSIKILKSAIKNGCKKWLIISSSSEYGRPKKRYAYKFSIKSNRIPSDEYGLSKAIFTDLCIKLAKEHNCKARIMRLFPVYGHGDKSYKIYTSLIKSINKNDNFFVKNPLETRDFTSVNFAVDKLLSATNFNIKPFKSSQIWHVSENNPLTIKEFVKMIWKKEKGKNNIFFNKKNVRNFVHISNKRSNW